MSRYDEPDDQEEPDDYVMVSDCCGVEMGEFLDMGICPQCREHCEPEKQEWRPKPPPAVPCCHSCGDVMPEACRGKRCFCDSCMKVLESLR